MYNLLKHFKAMQALAASYVQPGAYVNRHSVSVSDKTMRKEAFIEDMVYMLDCPEEREAVSEIVDKQTTSELSTRAAPYMNFTKETLVELIKDPAAFSHFIKDVRSMAASVVSQDETKGQD